LRHHNNIIGFWVYLESDRLDENSFRSKLYHSANSKNQQYKIRALVDYGINGEVITSAENGNKAELFLDVLGSVDYTLLQYACYSNP
jgi:hypothetical protein